MKLSKTLAFILSLIMICACAANASPVEMAEKVVRIGIDDALPFAEGASLMYIYFFDIGAQDSFLVLCGGESMLIDCGTFRSGPRISARLKMFNVSHIDYALNTHPHDDHINGFRSLSDDITLGCFMTCFPRDFDYYQIITLEHMNERGVEIIDITDADNISFGGNSIWLYQDKETTSVNSCSLVMHISYGDASALLLSDIGRSAQERLYLKYGGSLKADILKLPHHGLSKPRANMTKTVAPEICVLTNGNNANTAETLMLLASWRYPVIHSQHGTLEFVTDGKTWVYRQYPRIYDGREAESAQ